jgi:hypothetical protein
MESRNQILAAGAAVVAIAAYRYYRSGHEVKLTPHQETE